MIAKGKGHAVSKEWDLVADTIGLDVTNRRLEQTLAWGDSIRPYASSPAYAMRADSLALDTPGQQLKEVGDSARPGWAAPSILEPSSATGCAAIRWLPSSSSATPREPARGAEPHRGARTPNRFTWIPARSTWSGLRSTTPAVL